MNGFVEALASLFTPATFCWMMLGTSLGIVVGAVPGLTGAMLIALTLPLTFAMPYNDALVILISMYVGSISGGLITATLLRMPGTPASIMTTLDGYPLAQSGRPGRALGLGISASFVGGLVSFVFLLLLARPIAVWSTKFGPFEFFSLVLMALVLIASVSGRSLLRGVLSGCLGILLAMPGASPVTGEFRLTFGFPELTDGLELLPVLIGLFAISQIISDILSIDQPATAIAMSRRGIFLSLRDWKNQAANLLRSSFIGTWVGILPGIGANIGSVMAYATARTFSKKPDEIRPRLRRCDYRIRGRQQRHDRRRADSTRGDGHPGQRDRCDLARRFGDSRTTTRSPAVHDEPGRRVHDHGDVSGGERVHGGVYGGVAGVAFETRQRASCAVGGR